MLALEARLDAVRGHDFAGVHEPHVAELMAAAIAREIGTGHDQLTPRIRHQGRGRDCAIGDLTARVETFGRAVAVVLEADDRGPLVISRPSLRRLVNPACSIPSGPGFQRLVFFPASIARIVALAGGELVFVPSWAEAQVFHAGRGVGDLYSEDFKRRAAWDDLAPELVRFASLLARRRIALVSTHDLVAHVAGFDGATWPPLQALARRVEGCLRRYLARVARPAVETLVIPFMLGVLLDVHAQPSAGFAHTRLLAETIADYLDANGARLAARARPRLDVFPREYASYLELLDAPADPALVGREALRLLDDLARRTTVG